jgi:hypothetical protein
MVAKRVGRCQDSLCMNRAKFLAMRSRCGPRRRLSSPQPQEPDNFSGADMEHQPHSVTFGMRTLTDPEAVSSSRHFELGVQRLGNQSLCNIVLNKSCLWSAQWNYRILALGGVTVVAEMDLDNRIPEVQAVFFSSSSYTTFDHILGGGRRGKAAAWIHQLMKDPMKILKGSLRT